MINCRVHRWMGFALSAAFAASAVAAGSDSSKLNPYHERMLNEQIRQTAAQVLACKDTDDRCLRQQDLCQKLLQAGRLDEALQVAKNICETEGANEERRAVHHYLCADIYSRKMKAASSLAEMEQNRQLAAQAVNEIVAKNYPKKWGVSDHARVLYKELNDQSQMNIVRQKVAARQGIRTDNSREDIASAQRRYLDAKRGGGASAPSGAGGNQGVRAKSGGFLQSFANRRSAGRAESVSATSPVIQSAVTRAAAAAAAPGVTIQSQPNTVNLQNGGRITFSNRLADSGMMTSQPGFGASAGAASGSVSVSGAGVSTKDAVRGGERRVADKASGFTPGQQFSVRGTAGAGEASPYAAGQAPVSP
jgi:hypothetical protein